jgi:hypothetical protein
VMEPGKRGGGWPPIRRKRLAPVEAKTSGPLSPENRWPPFGRKRLTPDARQRVAHYREETDSGGALVRVQPGASLDLVRAAVAALRAAC